MGRYLGEAQLALQLLLLGRQLTQGLALPSELRPQVELQIALLLDIERLHALEQVGAHPLDVDPDRLLALWGGLAPRLLEGA